jgi:hypothetical protein
MGGKEGATTISSQNYDVPGPGPFKLIEAINGLLGPLNQKTQTSEDLKSMI